MAVKVRYFKFLRHGGDADAERVYRWHIDARSGSRMRAGFSTDRWKLTLEDYTEAARELCASVANYGFRPEGAIPIDPNGELLDGSHRVSCALALGIESVPVKQEDRTVWAPAWGEQWFIEHGMSDADLKRLRADFGAISGLVL